MNTALYRNGTAAVNFLLADCAGVTLFPHSFPTRRSSDLTTFEISATFADGTSATATTTIGAIAPSITGQPVSATVTTRRADACSAATDGTAPPSYQWQKNGANISGATGSSYTTPSTSTADSGSSFRVVVSNSAGSVTSTGATLTVKDRKSVV